MTTDADRETHFDPRDIPARAGVGLKPQHYADILRERPDIGWFEVHPENYMEEGGPPHHYLSAIRENYPISLHGVGLSIGAEGPLDREHLDRVKQLIDRYQPALFSEHLAWSSHDDIYYNDLLPLPYTQETLDRVVDHIDEIQLALGRRMLLENPSSYLMFESSTLEETEFLNSVCERSGCGLLLDVNNVFVSATNLSFDPRAYLQSFPLQLVEEIHLAGHKSDEDDSGARLLIDTHDREVADPVLELFAEVLEKTGPVPSLLERDSDIPPWPDLFRGVHQIDTILATTCNQNDLTQDDFAAA